MYSGSPSPWSVGGGVGVLVCMSYIYGTIPTKVLYCKHDDQTQHTSIYMRTLPRVIPSGLGLSLQEVFFFLSRNSPVLFCAVIYSIYTYYILRDDTDTPAVYPCWLAGWSTPGYYTLPTYLPRIHDSPDLGLTGTQPYVCTDYVRQLHTYIRK